MQTSNALVTSAVSLDFFKKYFAECTSQRSSTNMYFMNHWGSPHFSVAVRQHLMEIGG